jgi:hypothetical protein
MVGNAMCGMLDIHSCKENNYLSNLPLEVFLSVHQSSDNTITSGNKPENNLRNYSKVDINVLNHLMYQKSENNNKENNYKK